MFPIIVLVAIGAVAWRYRRAIGLDLFLKNLREGSGTAKARPVASRKPAVRRVGSPSAGATVSSPSAAERSRWSIPPFDSRRLPPALIVGVVLAVATAFVDSGGRPILAQTIGLLIGPFVGGLVVRSWWWVLIAAALGALLGAGAGLSSLFVAFPVGLVAYSGIRADPRRWLGRFGR